MAERTLGAICLGPIDNAQGGYKFMSLRSGKLIQRYAWTEVPMTQEVIDRVIFFGQNEKVPEGVSINNLHNEDEYIDFEYDDIEGVYDYNIQQNLYPQNAQNTSNNAKDESQLNESTYLNQSNNSNDNDQQYCSKTSN